MNKFIFLLTISFVSVSSFSQEKRWGVQGEYDTEDNAFYRYLDGKRNPGRRTSALYHRITDRLGNTVSIVRGDGSEVLKARYDEWGKMTCDRNDIGFIRGFTGHETLSELGLINMNGRMFDPFTARFLSPDDYVQTPLSPQGFNRYSYCMNNPLRYTDPSGELAWFVPIITGAIVGATTSALTYTASIAVSGNKWNFTHFLKFAGIGALGGAVSGAFGCMSMSSSLGKFTNSMGFNIFGQTSSSVITNVIFENEMSFKDLLSVAAGALVGTSFPRFKAIEGSVYENTFGEIFHNTIRGLGTGLVSGVVSSSLYDDYQRVEQGLIGGALSGFSKTVVSNLVLGVPLKYCQDYKGTQGKGTYRSGGLFKIITNKLIGGITLGNSMLAYDGTEQTELHEWYHEYQQYKMGWSVFYSQIVLEYMKALIRHENPYNTHGYLDFDAEQFRKFFLR